jgi:hypothetical protein
MKPRVKRPLRNDHEEEERRKRRTAIIALLIVGLMAFSSLAYVLVDNTSSGNQMEYGDYEFEFRDLGGGAGVLITEINGQEVEFQNLPVQVGYLEVDPAAIALLQASQQVALAAPTDIDQQDAAMIDYARLQLSLAIPKTFNAMTAEDSRYMLPVLNCSHASPQMPVIVFTNANQTTITTEGACILVNGQQRDLMRLKDRIIFEYYGILKDGQVVDD